MDEAEYTEGQEIEVTDEAFKDSWYAAKIIDKIDGKNKKMILIEYEKLMAGNGGLNRFKDSVDVDLVRPKPPQDQPDQTFQIDQIVDGFLANGWWKGKICSVVGNEQYKVLMSSPTLEQQEIEFGVDKLRIHREFVDGEWVIPQPQDQDDAEETDEGHDDNMFSPAYKKLKKDETEEGFSSLIEDFERIAAFKNLNYYGKEEESPQKRMKEKCQNLNDNYSNPLEVHSGEMVSESSTTGVQQSSVVENEVQKPLYLARCSSMSLDRGSRMIEDQQCEKQYDEVTSENGDILFVKKLSMWKDLDSKIQMFTSMQQQKPHFQPLEQLQEPLREGRAFGYMLSFMSLVDKTSNAQVTEPKSNFENKLAALTNLEEVGFNVKPIRDRLEELLSFKERRVQLAGRSDQFEGMMKDVKIEEESVNREVSEIEEKLRVINESLAKINKECSMDEIAMKIKGSSIGTLERKLRDIKEKIKNDQHEFNHVASAPWSSK